MPSFQYTEAPSVDELPLGVAIQVAVSHLQEVRRDLAALDTSIVGLEERLAACLPHVEDGHPLWPTAVRAAPLDGPLTDGGEGR